MKIALITPGGVDRSGTQRVIPCLLWLIERLVGAGDDLHVFALRQEAVAGEWDLLGAKVRNSGGRMPAWGVFRALAAEHRRVPFDIIHALWASPSGVIAAVAGKWLDVPVLLHLVGGDLADLPDIAYGGRRTARGRVAVRIAVAGARHIIAESDFVVDQARALGIKAKRVPFGVALDKWPSAVPRPRMPNAPARLLHVGHVNRVKDHGMLLGMAARLAAKGVDFILETIGEDTLGGEAQRLAARLGLADRVRFLGLMPHHEVRRHFENADILLVSSRHEGVPMAAVEAAIMGVPTVGTHVGLLAEWTPDAARTVAPRDDAAMAQIVAELLSDDDARLSLAKRAQVKALTENADVTARCIRAIYEQLGDRAGTS